MIPSSHDITPTNIDRAIFVIDALLTNGNELLIVTKPRFKCVRQLIDTFEEYALAIQLRLTIGSVSSNNGNLERAGLLSALNHSNTPMNAAGIQRFQLSRYWIKLLMH